MLVVQHDDSSCVRGQTGVMTHLRYRSHWCHDSFALEVTLSNSLLLALSVSHTHGVCPSLGVCVSAKARAITKTRARASKRERARKRESESRRGRTGERERDRGSGKQTNRHRKRAEGRDGGREGGREKEGESDQEKEGGGGRIETSRASEDSDAAGIIRNKLKVVPHAITSEPFPAVA